MDQQGKEREAFSGGGEGKQRLNQPSFLAFKGRKKKRVREGEESEGRE